MIFLVLIQYKHVHTSTQCAGSELAEASPGLHSICEYFRDTFTLPVYFHVPLPGGLRIEMRDNLSVALKCQL